MRHQKRGRILKRKKGPRRALLRILAKELILHGKIKTTEGKAKELKRYFDRLVRTAQKDSLASKRKLFGELKDRAVVNKLTKELKEQLKKRKSGHTRITKLGQRKGDRAPIVQIEII